MFWISVLKSGAGDFVFGIAYMYTIYITIYIYVCVHVFSDESLRNCYRNIMAFGKS